MVIPDDYRFLDNLTRFNLLERRDVGLQSIVPDFYADYAEHLAKVLTNDSMPKATRKLLFEDWDMAYFTCGQAAKYLYVRKEAELRETPDDDIVCHDDASLCKRYKDSTPREVKKPGRDRRTKKYQAILAAMPLSERELIEYANAHRSKTYKEWVGGANPCDKLSDYTWRGREYEIVSVDAFHYPDDYDDTYNSSGYDAAQRESIDNGFVACDGRTNPMDDPAIWLLEQQKKDNIIASFDDDIDKMIVKSLMDGNTDIHTYQSLKITKNEFYKRTHKMEFILFPLLKGGEINKPMPLSSETKVCSVCGEEKSIDLFGNDKRKTDGKQSKCKNCDKNRKQK